MIKPIKLKELSKYINTLMKRDPILSNISTEGEVSNYKISGGNIYFVLKDDNITLRCIIFKNMDLAKDISLQNGMMIVAKGAITTYEYGSYYQLLVKDIVLQGTGDIYKRFEILKNKLLKDGYFDLDHKKKIPKMPSSIGVITSESGAAVRDIINTVHRRFPICDIYLYPSLVQGSEAALTLIEGLKYFNKMKNADVIIIGRGGGSFEDLDCFNNESLLYEIFKSSIPIISAVGHEVDNMLSDFVADLRASTPTAAGELATPILQDLKNELYMLKNNLDDTYLRYLIEGKKFLDYSLSELKYYNPLDKVKNLKMELNNKFERIYYLVLNHNSNKKHILNEIRMKLEIFNPNEKLNKEKERLEIFRKFLLTNCQNNIIHEKYKLEYLKTKIEIFNLNKILNYGYTKVYIDNKNIKSINEINIKDSVKIYFKDGIATATIKNKEIKID